MAIETLPEPSIPITTPFRPRLGFLAATPIIAVATICLFLVILSAILAPWLSPHDPLLLAPSQRLKPASAQFLLGTDAYGRDVLSTLQSTVDQTKEQIRRGQEQLQPPGG